MALQIMPTIKLLEQGDIRRLDGEFKIGSEDYGYKAYKITQPQSLIRIDIKEKKNATT